MMYSPGMDTERIKHFLKAVYKIRKSELKRAKHRKKISTHIGRIKKKTLGKKINKEDIEKEFERLEENINDALKREKQILEEQRHGSDLVAQLKNRLDKLEIQLKQEKNKKESLNEIKSALQRIHGEIRHRKKNRIKIRKRERELEDKIKKKKKI